MHQTHHRASDDPASAHLLVVDDDLVQRSIICRIGAQVGYAATGAATFEEAVGLAKSKRFDCITLDLALGEHHGIEVLKALAGAVARTPIIVTSGCDEQILTLAVRVGQSLDLDVRGPIPKPLNLATLRQTLLQAMPAAPASAPKRLREPTGEDLAKALEAGEIGALYQPRVDVVTEAPVGCAAVPRWHSATFGDVPAATLLPLADAAHLAGRLGLQVLRRAVADCAGLVQRHPGFAIAVPVSAAMLFDPALAEEIDRALAAAAVPASALVLEIPERVAMADVDRVVNVLVALRIKGLRIAVSEFGSGFHSFAALARLPVSELKIDRALLAGDAEDAGGLRIAEATIMLARQFRIMPVADGVDDARTLRHVAEAGCAVVQGRVYAPALDEVTLAEWIIDQLSRSRSASAPRRTG